MTDLTKQTNDLNTSIPAVPQHVVSERLVIRPSSRDDTSALQRWWNDPDVIGPGSSDGMQYDEKDMDDWFRRYIDKQEAATHFIICVRQSSEMPIGELYIAGDDRPGGVNLALIIGETTLLEKGYGSEALLAYCDALFASGHCDAVRVDVRRANEHARRMCEHAGFQIEVVWANGLFQTMILTRAARELKLLWAQPDSN